MNFKIVSGYVMAFGVLGFTTYAIYKHVKNKENENMIISSEEARAEVERRRVVNQSYRTGLVDIRNSKMDDSAEEFGGRIPMDVRGQAFTGPMVTVPQEDDEEEGDLFDEDISEEAEEGRILKHDPSSQEARQQFIKMELADLGDIDMKQTLLKLFEFPFNPTVDGDRELKTKLIDYRVRFFGFGSKWTQDISFAEVILHFARSATFNCNESVQYWVDYFLQFNTLNHEMSSNTLDAVIVKLNNHTYYNDQFGGTYGLFGLTDASMEGALRVSMRNMDTSVTYEIEFNEFLKSVV